MKYPPSRENNIAIDPVEEPKIISDFIALDVGYALFDLKAGDRVHIKPTDGEILYHLLRLHFGK